MMLRLSLFFRWIAVVLLTLGALTSIQAGTRVSTQKSDQTNDHTSESTNAHQPLLSGVYERLQDGAPVDLSAFNGKVVLIVNTASKCGYTGQYEGLEALYSKFKDQGLVVLGFPSSSFRQEYKEDSQIAAFCKNTYGIQFPMFSSVEVTGEGAAPLFKRLKQATGQSVRWNFNKYLIGRDGQSVQWFDSSADPMGTSLQEAVARLL